MCCFNFLDESKINWMEFPLYKLDKPTYQFNSYFKRLNMTLAGVFVAYLAIKNIANLGFICNWLNRLLTLIRGLKPRQMLIATGDDGV